MLIVHFEALVQMHKLYLILLSFLICFYRRKNELRIRLRERTGDPAEKKAAQEQDDLHGPSAGRVGAGIRENSIS